MYEPSDLQAWELALGIPRFLIAVSEAANSLHSFRKEEGEVRLARLQKSLTTIKNLANCGDYTSYGIEPRIAEYEVLLEQVSTDPFTIGKLALTMCNAFQESCPLFIHRKVA